MKKLSLLFLICLPFSSCALRVYRDGKPIIADYTNFKGKTTYTDGSFSFTREGEQDVATPTNAAGNQIVKGMVVAGGGAVGL